MIGNWIDLMVLFYLAIHFISGTRKGFLSILIVVFSLILALVLTFFTYSYSADFFIKNFAIEKAYANVMGFFTNIFILKTGHIFLVYKILPKTLVKIKKLNSAKKTSLSQRTLSHG